jgi:hypothetical protein
VSTWRLTHCGVEGLFVLDTLVPVHPPGFLGDEGDPRRGAGVGQDKDLNWCYKCRKLAMEWSLGKRDGHSIIGFPATALLRSL